MRVHIQTPLPGDQFPVTEEIWQQACERAGEKGHVVSFANDRAGFEANMAEAELLISVPADFYKFLPMKAPHLKMVFTLAAGVEKLAPFDWLPPGVPLINNSGAHSAKMFEYGLMAFVMLGQRFPEVMIAQQKHEWRPGKIYTSVLQGKRATIVGVGGLGSPVARAARVLGMQTVGVRMRAAPHPDFDRVAASDALDDLLPESDFLVLACPLTDATRNLINRERFGRIKRGTGFINVSRGAVVDQDALCEALEQGHLSGAVIDVVTPEPLPVDSRLWTTKNLVITPHISADDPETYVPFSLDIMFANLRAWREGKVMPNQVDTAKGY